MEVELRRDSDDGGQLVSPIMSKSPSSSSSKLGTSMSLSNAESSASLKALSASCAAALATSLLTPIAGKYESIVRIFTCGGRAKARVAKMCSNESSSLYASHASLC